MKPKPWWYISYASGTGFLGACQVQADSELQAVERARELRISPPGGGEALVCGPLAGEVIRAGGMPVNKLLTAAEIQNPVDTEGKPL